MMFVHDTHVFLINIYIYSDGACAVNSLLLDDLVQHRLLVLVLLLDHAPLCLVVTQRYALHWLNELIGDGHINVVRATSISAVRRRRHYFNTAHVIRRCRRIHRHSRAAVRGLWQRLEVQCILQRIVAAAAGRGGQTDVGQSNGCRLLGWLRLRGLLTDAQWLGGLGLFQSRTQGGCFN